MPFPTDCIVTQQDGFPAQELSHLLFAYMNCSYEKLLSLSLFLSLSLSLSHVDGSFLICTVEALYELIIDKRVSIMYFML